MKDAPSSSPLRLVPPPAGYVVAFLAGWLAQRVAWKHAPESPAPIAALGVGLAALGVALGLSAIATFAAARTTVLPHGTPSRFVVRGPYRWTRNPMYVASALVYTGAALWSGTWLAVPFVALPLIHLSNWIIPMEESALLTLFGESYAEYRRRVRRWL